MDLTIIDNDSDDDHQINRFMADQNPKLED